MVRHMAVLQKLSVLNRDNGLVFTDTTRLDAIETLLKNNTYKRVNRDGLFRMYSQVPVNQLEGPVFIVSSHVDCEHHITKCFAEYADEATLLGTFDNSITNASIVYLMLFGNLPENILVAFTGDEEENSRGAKDVCRFIRDNKLDVKNIFVLDVTEEGWKKGADFTVENDFWDEEIGKQIVNLVQHSGYKWNFVPAEPDDIPEYVPKEIIINIEAYEDESWEYDEQDLPCFSFCLPTKGEMHSNDGILARAVSYVRYTEILGRLLTELEKGGNRG